MGTGLSLLWSRHELKRPSHWLSQVFRGSKESGERLAGQVGVPEGAGVGVGGVGEGVGQVVGPSR